MTDFYIDGFVGNGFIGSTGDGGTAQKSELDGPYGLFIDQSDNLFLTDLHNFKIRKVNIASNQIVTIAGNGIKKFGGDGYPAVFASFYYPKGIVSDSIGNVYIADSEGSRVRMISVITNIITTLVGDGTYRYNGDNIACTSATLNFPRGLAIDSTDNIYIADAVNNRIRMVNQITKIITTVVGNGAVGIGGDGGPARLAQLNQPAAVAIDRYHTMYIADTLNGCIRVVKNGIIQTFVGSCGNSGVEMGTDSNQNIPNMMMRLDNPLGITVHQSTGDVYFTDTANNQVCLVKYGSNVASRFGQDFVYGYGGNGGPVSNALFNAPIGLALDSSGNVYVADTDNNVVRRMYLSSSSTASSSSTTTTTTNGGSTNTVTTTTSATTDNTSNSVNAVGGGIGAFLFVVSLIFIFRVLTQLCKAYNNRQQRHVVVAVEIDGVMGENHNHDVTRQADGVVGTDSLNHPSTSVPGGSNDTDNSNHHRYPYPYHPYPFHLYPFHHPVATGVEVVATLTIDELTASLRIGTHPNVQGGGICHADAVFAPVPAIVPNGPTSHEFGQGTEGESNQLNHMERNGQSVSIPSTNIANSDPLRASVDHQSDIPLAVAVPVYGRSQY